MKKLFSVQSLKDHSKNSRCINKQNYHQHNKIRIANVHLNNLDPVKANNIANTKVNSITRILPKSRFELVKSVAAEIPKKTWDEAIQKLDQYVLSSLRYFDLINFTLSKIKLPVNQNNYKGGIVNGS